MASRIKRWNWAIHEELPACGGCYAIYRDGALIYIGSGKNLRSRLGGYGIGRTPPFNRPRFGDPCRLEVKLALSVKYGDWAMRELRLLRRIKPPLNKRDAGGGYLIGRIGRGDW